MHYFFRIEPHVRRQRQGRFFFHSEEPQNVDNSTLSSSSYISPNQCNRFEPPKDFFVIGHSGGDPLKYCENTLEATR